MQPKYPLIPLKNIVIFPGIIIPVFIGRELSVNALKFAQENNQDIVFCLQKLGIDTPEIDDILSVGVVAEVVKVDKVDGKTYKVLVNGKARVEIQNPDKESGFLQCGVKNLKDDNNFPSKKSQKETISVLYKQLEQYLALNKNIPSVIINEILDQDNIVHFINVVAHFLMFSVNDKQNILTIDSLKDRAQFLLELLMREIDVFKVEDKLHSVIRDNIEKTQREFYLKEKIKAIQAELGGEKVFDYNDVDRYEERVYAGNFPEEVQEKALRELGKLRSMANVSAESGIIKSYLEWILELPWMKSVEKPFEISNLGVLLDKYHYGLEKVKERIIEFLAIYKMTSDIQGSILCLAGPSGVGKTSVAKAIAKVMGRKFIKIACGGMNDEAELRGHRRTYVGSMPGRIIQAIRNAKTNNPIILLDEVDKMSKSFQSNPAAVLLEILDKEQNQHFYDYYLEIPFDLSNILFIVTANNTFDIPAHLLDRMEVIKISGYNVEEKKIIARDYLLPKVTHSHGLKPDQLMLDNKILQTIIKLYTKEAGLRELERCLSAIARKTAYKLITDNSKIKFSDDIIGKMLGYPKYKYSLIPTEPKVGISLGLAYTVYGGDVMPIEVTIFHGKGELRLTGKMGEVMQESSQTALSFVRLIADKLKLKNDFYQKYDIHIHIPENAITKDGPSAGVAIAIALISAFLKKPIDNKAAMTGEITLHGQVMPVGGLKEKLYAAEQQGIERVYVPEANIEEVEEIKKHLTTPMKIHGINTIQDVIKQLLNVKRIDNQQFKVKKKKTKQHQLNWLD